jgi:hypothetical protein
MEDFFGLESSNKLCYSGDKARRPREKKEKFLLGRVNDIGLMLTIVIGQVVMRAS